MGNDKKIYGKIVKGQIDWEDGKFWIKDFNEQPEPLKPATRRISFSGDNPQLITPEKRGPDRNNIPISAAKPRQKGIKRPHERTKGNLKKRASLPAVKDNSIFNEKDFNPD